MKIEEWRIALISNSETICSLVIRDLGGIDITSAKSRL